MEKKYYCYGILKGRDEEESRYVLDIEKCDPEVIKDGMWAVVKHFSELFEGLIFRDMGNNSSGYPKGFLIDGAGKYSGIINWDICDK